MVSEFIGLQFNTRKGLLVDCCFSDLKLRNSAKRLSLIFHIELLLLKLNEVKAIPATSPKAKRHPLVSALDLFFFLVLNAVLQ